MDGLMGLVLIMMWGLICCWVCLVVFLAAHYLEDVSVGQRVDMAFHLADNVWKGDRNLQLQVVDVR